MVVVSLAQSLVLCPQPPFKKIEFWKFSLSLSVYLCYILAVHLYAFIKKPPPFKGVSPDSSGARNKYPIPSGDFHQQNKWKSKMALPYWDQSCCRMTAASWSGDHSHNTFTNNSKFNCSRECEPQWRTSGFVMFLIFIMDRIVLPQFQWFVWL